MPVMKQEYSLWDILTSLLFPQKFILLSLTFLPRTILSQPSLLLPWNLPLLKSLWFTRFWSFVGPQVRENSSALVIPLLSGHISRGITHPSPIHPPLSGTVLEIGPGSGMWLPTLSQIPSITKIYGVEPNEGNAASLRQTVKTAGLEGRYNVIPVGIEDLEAVAHIEKGSVDSVMTVMCLCSIPEPQKNIKMLYEYLKPDGKWYVYEHVKTFDGELPGQGESWEPKQPKWLGWYQSFMNIFWPHFVGGCEMCRDTSKYLLQDAGPWQEVDLAQPANSPWFQTMPHIIGVLTK
ncbi:uncharacterized protein QC763_213050 [Podospora pseudopauciseta]|uniref:Methyltransferase-like protein 7B n=2 Tax=Podospora TaxID=5144 RepID=A0ABR0HRT1_9PEZI|nr:hypothetical protein QC763_213050 [Podospora pseudopauciseta]KAK4680429.1 hypothetical protein QC764_213050 [Podospora pseudoanserina]